MNKQNKKHHRNKSIKYIHNTHFVKIDQIILKSSVLKYKNLSKFEEVIGFTPGLMNLPASPLVNSQAF